MCMAVFQCTMGVCYLLPALRQPAAHAGWTPEWGETNPCPEPAPAAGGAPGKRLRPLGWAHLCCVRCRSHGCPCLLGHGVVGSHNALHVAALQVGVDCQGQPGAACHSAVAAAVEAQARALNRGRGAQGEQSVDQLLRHADTVEVSASKAAGHAGVGACMRRKAYAHSRPCTVMRLQALAGCRREAGSQGRGSQQPPA